MANRCVRLLNWLASHRRGDSKASSRGMGKGTQEVEVLRLGYSKAVSLDASLNERRFECRCCPFPPSDQFKHHMQFISL